jgi:hypothetical protein
MAWRCKTINFHHRQLLDCSFKLAIGVGRRK